MKKRLTISGSTADLATNCTYWVGKEVDVVEASDVMVEGTRLHSVAEALLRGTTDPKTLTNPQDLQVARRVADIASLPGFQVVSIETAWALDIHTLKTRELDTQGQHRNYHDVDFLREIPFTIDVAYRYLDEFGQFRTVVCDWKFGPGGLTNYTAETSAQLALAGMPFTPDFVEFRALDGTVSVSPWHHLGIVEQVAQNLREAANNSIPTAGPHCTFCAYKSDCEVGQRALVRNLNKLAAVPPTEQYQLTYEIQSPDHARWSLFALNFIRREAEALEERIREYATEHTVTDKDGRIYRQAPYADGYTLSPSKFTKAELTKFAAEGKAKFHTGRTRWGWYAKR